MRIIPAIDLKGGRTVRLVEGEAHRETRYDLDPLEVAAQFERDGADSLHLVDLDGAFAASGDSNRAIVEGILARLTIPVELGGGLRTAEAVEAVLAAGARWAIVGTLAIQDLEAVSWLAARYAGRIVVGIDARDGRVAVRGWTEVTDVDAIELAASVGRAGVERVIYTDIARDGHLEGPNVDATARLARATGLRVTASGGVGSLEDIRRLRDVEPDGVEACIVGKALYERRFALPEAIRAAAGGVDE